MSQAEISKYPPVASISASRFGGNSFPIEQVITVPSASIYRLPNNPNRFNWIMINEGANDVRVSNLPNISATSGWLLAANGGNLSMDWSEDGEAVTYDLYMIASGADSNIRIREVVRS